MALPAKVYWAKLQKALRGQSEHEQIAILRRYVAEWPGWDDIQYRKMREQAEKLLRKLETSESTRSTKGQHDPFHVKRQGDGQICLIGAVNSGKSALVSTLTAAHTEVADYAFTTQRPVPGMLTYADAAVQLIDTPALVPGTSAGEGSGRRLLHLYSTADAAALVLDLAQDPLEQMAMIAAELAAGQMMRLSHPVCTEFHARSKGGIRFAGIPIDKAAQTDARDICAASKIAHAEICIRECFVSAELQTQIQARHLLPTIIIANKNDLPGAERALNRLRQAYPDDRIIDVNFLDEAHFETLKRAFVQILGLIQVSILDKPDPDAACARNLVLVRASTLGDVFDHMGFSAEERPKAANIWGASVKYAGQEVGVDHIVVTGDKIWTHQ
jgi:uncharacterized protein